MRAQRGPTRHDPYVYMSCRAIPYQARLALGGPGKGVTCGAVCTYSVGCGTCDISIDGSRGTAAAVCKDKQGKFPRASVMVFDDLVDLTILEA